MSTASPRLSSGKTTWLLIGGLVLLALVATLLPRSTDEPPALMRQISFGLPMQPQGALALIAVDQGFFAEQGLEVSVKEYPSGKRALHDGLFQGEVDIISVSDVPVTFAAFERQDFGIIASTFSANNVNRVIARRDHGIHDPQDLQGKRIATQRASAVHFFMHLFLLHNRLSESDMQLSYLKAEQLPDALLEGRIDAFSMREPYISQAAERLGDKAVLFAAPGVYEQMELLVASRALVEQEPAVIEGILKAMLAAEDFIREQPQQAAEIVARRLGVEPEKIQAILPTLNLRISFHQSLLLLLEDEARWAIKSGLVSSDALPNYLVLFQLEALKQLKPGAVTVIK
jgi:ABC-type nitrate/sulfonate/bicarbonate transport system substrate-binding protein